MPLSVPVPRLTAPTDNLYRFASVFGLTLVILAFVLMSVRIYQHNALVHDARVNAVVAGERVHQLATDSHDIFQRTALAAQPGQPTTTASTMPKITDASANDTAQMEKNLREAQELNLTSLRIRAELDADQSTLNANMHDLSLLLAVGSFISAAGFVGWFFRLQLPEDKLLQARVELRLQRLKQHRVSEKKAKS